ncbi:hypothetical protein KKH26_00575 [Patescibacteria group bacterium]|nr:hypothetical protein [Patescibacteria group bacterium]
MEKTAEILLVEKGCIFLVDEESELEMVMLCAFEGRHKIGHRAKITDNEHRI